nr:hypothetical protein [Caballeronia sordidicola]
MKMSVATERKSHPMPEMAAFVANLRAAFGSSIDAAVARGKAGEPTFYARENGRTVGTPPVDDLNRWTAGTDICNRHFCRGCDGSCVGTSTRCSERNNSA